MKRRGFTMLEIISAVLIVGILSALALPYFQNVVERAKDEVCTTNIETLKKAVDIHVMEEQVVPASLAELPQRCIDRAYAQVWSRKSWKLALAKSILQWQDRGLAYAFTRFHHLRCPKNPDPDAVSYGLNSEVAGKSAAEYKALAADTIIVGDADAYVADFCKVVTTEVFAGQSGNVKDIIVEVICPQLGGLIERRGHVKHGVLGGKEKFLIATTGNEVILNLKNGKGGP